MHLSLYHSRGYFSVFYRQLINNSLGNLPSSLFSNLGNLTELYVEIYMYRSLFIVSLTQFISRYKYIYIHLHWYWYLFRHLNKEKRIRQQFGWWRYSRQSLSFPHDFSLHWQELSINAIPNRERWRRVLEGTFSM